MVFIVPMLLSAQVYDTPIPLTQAMQGVTQAQFANVGGAGYQDICVSTYLDKRLAWFNGDGEGSFLAELELGSEFDDIFIMAIGPIGDGGLNDIVVVTLEGNYYLIERTGVDSYEEPVLFASFPGIAKQLELMDLNGDGYLDLVTANEDGGLYYFPYTPGFGYGTLEYIHDGDGVIFFDFGDFNNDGLTDVSFIDDYLRLYWVEGLLEGEFGTPILLLDGDDLGLRGVHTSDYDSDGDGDILAVAYQTGDIYFFTNLGSGTFLMSTLPHVVGVQRVHAIDMDDDGDKDLVLADDFEVSWREQQGILWGAPETIGSFEGFFASLDVKDVDNDGRGEVLLGSLDFNGVQYFENVPGQGVLPGRRISSDAIGVVGLQLADMDGDGDKDIVSASKDDHKVSWYEKIAPGEFGPQRYITDRAIDVTDFLALDFYGTGVQEIIVERKDLYGNPRLALIDNDGTGQFAYPVDLITMGELYAMASGHLDFDTKEDIVFATATNNGTLYRVKVNSQNNLSVSVIGNVTSEIFDIELSDMNGDGFQDIVISTSAYGMVWYKNNGNGLSYDGPFYFDDILEGYFNFSIYDLDQDADQDIVVCAVDGGEAGIYWYENSGTGTFTRHNTGRLCLEDTKFSVGDVEGDGDVDLFYRDPVTPYPRLVLNDGSMQFTSSTTLCNGCITEETNTALLTEDADGDGDLDAYYVSDDIYYTENEGLNCPEDINRDGWIDINDFLIFNSNYGSSCTGYCPSDINADGTVGIEDFIMLNSVYGESCN